jgi:cell division protein ZapA
MSQIEVKIMGQSYLLGCPEGGETQFKEAVDRVDTAMCKIRDAGKVKARDRIAVLAALNLAFDLAQPPTATPSASAPQVAPTTTDMELSSGSQSAITGLLQRLDRALGVDGHLI